MLFGCHLICLIVCLNEPELRQVLVDAQQQSRSNLRQGHAVMELTYQIPERHKSGLIKVEAEVTWDGESVFQKHRFHSESFTPFGRISQVPIEDTAWDFMVRNPTEIVYYNAAGNVLAILPVNEDTTSPVLDFRSWHAWLTAHPPHHTNGRPWVDMINFDVVHKAAKSVMTFEKLDPNTIRQTRKDGNGGVMVMDFSLSHGGNLVKFSYTAANGQKPETVGEYKWKKLGKIDVLDTCTIETTSSGREEREKYTLKVKSVDLEPVDEVMLTRQGILNNIIFVNNLYIRDRINMKDTRIR